MPGEYIEIRTFFLSGIEPSDFLEAGFKINKIQSQKKQMQMPIVTFC